MGDARKAALIALERCRRSGAWSDAVLGSVMEEAKLDGRDRGLAAALCYGVLQNRMLLDHAIAQFSAVKLSKAEPKVLDILRISAYQLYFMDKIPASAAVNEGVKLCRGLGYARAAGYVNAVLRKISDSGVLPEITGTEAERLSVRYSHPLWLTEYLIGRLGAEEAERFLECSNSPTPAVLQVSTLKTNAEALLVSLAESGVKAEKHPFLPDCVIAADLGDITRLSAFQNGEFYVQDAAAKMAVLAAEIKAGQKILDACAAPGGKSFAAAILSGGTAEITACDLHENKLKRIREGAERLGLDGISTLACDARAYRPEWDGAFDLVIADVPCSGLGVIRKKPDIRYKDPAEFTALPEIQLGILKNVSRYVAPGGTLLYSTCTVRQEENAAVGERFLVETPEFAAEDFTAADGTASKGGMLQLWPHINGTDGFFIAKLRKTK